MWDYTFSELMRRSLLHSVYVVTQILLEGRHERKTGVGVSVCDAWQAVYLTVPVEHSDVSEVRHTLFEWFF
jgi:hypothetical protein